MVSFLDFTFSDPQTAPEKNFNFLHALEDRGPERAWAYLVKYVYGLQSERKAARTKAAKVVGTSTVNAAINSFNEAPPGPTAQTVALFGAEVAESWQPPPFYVSVDGKTYFYQAYFRKGLSMELPEVDKGFLKA